MGFLEANFKWECKDNSHQSFLRTAVTEQFDTISSGSKVDSKELSKVCFDFDFILFCC